MKKILVIILFALIASSLLAQLTLESAIRLALENNKELLMAKEDVKIAEYNYNDVRGMLLPQINLNAGYTLKKNWLPDSAIPPSFSFFDNLDVAPTGNDEYLAKSLDGIMQSMMPSKTKEEASVVGQVQMQQILFSGGKLINRIRVLDKIKTLQSNKFELSQQSIIIDVIESYYNLFLAQEVLKIQRQALSNAELHLARVENTFEQGLVSEYDKLRAELEVSRLYPEVLNSENMKNLALENFKRITGYDRNDVLVLSDLVTEKDLLDFDLETAINIGKDQRIELYLTEVMKEIYQVQYNAERGNYLPNIVLSADITKYNVPNSFEVKSDDFGTMASVGIGFQMPLFTGFSNTSKALRAKHELRKSEYEAINARDLISLEIRQNWQNYQHSLRNLDTQKKNKNLAQRALMIAESRYQNQTGIQLEVFDAQFQYNAAKISLAQAEIEISKNYYKLKKSLGYNLKTLIGE